MLGLAEGIGVRVHGRRRAYGVRPDAGQMITICALRSDELDARLTGCGQVTLARPP